MRVLIVHEEERLVAGAERMLLYFLDGVKEASGLEVAVAAVKESQFGKLLPDVEKIWIQGKRQFSFRALQSQLTSLVCAHRERPFDLVHGWAARDWELTSLFRWRAGMPAIGTLHDHPTARFHGRLRQWLMRVSARHGLGKVVCVSEAVQAACRDAGYPRSKVEVVHNGLPAPSAPPRVIATDRPFRLGYLGVLSERKGLRALFMLLEELSRSTVVLWDIRLAGGAQDLASEKFVGQLRQDFGGRDWWSRVQWCGWTNNPIEFLRSIDLLIVPSSEFDPFPTVLLEAGQQALPVLAASVGGIPEIVVDGTTGWLFKPERPADGARLIVELLAAPERCAAAGQRAYTRIQETFSLRKMVASYTKLYSTLATND